MCIRDRLQPAVAVVQRKCMKTFRSLKQSNWPEWQSVHCFSPKDVQCVLLYPNHWRNVAQPLVNPFVSTTWMFSCICTARQRLLVEARSAEPVLSIFLIRWSKFHFPLSREIYASFGKHCNFFRSQTFTKHRSSAVKKWRNLWRQRNGAIVHRIFNSGEKY